MIKLYALITSPFAMKVHCYLLYKQLDFQVTYVKPYNFESQLPLGNQVPVLRIDDEVKADSQAIGLWLDDHFKDKALLPKQQDQRQTVIAADNWVNQFMIPTVFYSIYPQLNWKLFETAINTLRLGRCVSKTASAMPPGLWLLWPLFIRQAGFIKQIVAPYKGSISSAQQRRNVLIALEKKLCANNYIAATATPSLADISCWPLLAVPYMLRLKAMDDILDYPHIVQWLKRLQPQLMAATNQPALVPANLNPLLF